MGNSTLSELSDGLHNVTVYANDTFGNVGKSQIINFIITKREPFPIVPVVGTAVVAVIAVAGLLFHHKKHKPNLVKKV